MRAAPSIFSAVVATLLIGCSDSTGPSDGPSIREPDSPEEISFQVSPSTATLLHGGTLQLATTFGGNPALSHGPVSVAWQSSNDAVATVSSSGLVRGISGGQATIVATWGGYRASALVFVTGPMKKHDGPAVCMKRIPSGERSLTPC